MLEGDITGCFDNISMAWLMENIPIEKRILHQWLKAGYIEKDIAYPTRKGTPQGGIISPTLANMTLDGLEHAIHAAVPRRSRVNFIRYADDFIITGKSKTILENNVLPAVKKFLEARGLTLSEEKTKIPYIEHGFTFLGQTFHKHGNKLHITPSKEGILTIIRKVGMVIRKHRSAPMIILIKKLNEILRGWANYHRHVISSEVFRRVDSYVYDQLWRMIRRRHSNKSRKWLAKKYWRAAGKWVFTTFVKYKNKCKLYQVVRFCSICIRRYRKIKAKANPYLPEFRRYFRTRKHVKEAKLWRELTARQLRLAYILR